MTHDQFTPEEEITRKTPYDCLVEKEEPSINIGYREAALIYTRLITLAIDYITTANNPLVASYGVAYALDLPVMGGMSQRQCAKIIGCSHGTISTHTVEFKKIADLA